MPKQAPQSTAKTAQPRTTIPPGGHARCTVCRNAECARIELFMARGGSKRRAARRFNVSADAVQRHWTNHVSPEVKAARIAQVLQPGANLKALVLEEDASILDNLRIVRGALMRQLDLSTEECDAAAVASVSSQLIRVAETIGKFTGELRKHSTVEHQHLVFSPDYLTLRQKLTEALRPYPDALAAVVAVFKALGAKATDELASEPLNVTPKALEASHG